nr:MAG TPA: hypothetical protein [Caudoviricetes sp.]
MRSFSRFSANVSNISFFVVTLNSPFVSRF